MQLEARAARGRWNHRLLLVSICKRFTSVHSDDHICTSFVLSQFIGAHFLHFFCQYLFRKWKLRDYRCLFDMDLTCPHMDRNIWFPMRSSHDLFIRELWNTPWVSCHHVAVIIFHRKTLNTQVDQSLLHSIRQQSLVVWGFSHVYVVSGLRCPPLLLLLFGGHQWLITCPRRAPALLHWASAEVNGEQIINCLAISC